MERSPIDLFHDALDAADVSYHERETGIVDSYSGCIVKALLTAGWRLPDQPDPSCNTSGPPRDTRVNTD